MESDSEKKSAQVDMVGSGAVASKSNDADSSSSSRQESDAASPGLDTVAAFGTDSPGSAAAITTSQGLPETRLADPHALTSELNSSLLENQSDSVSSASAGGASIPQSLQEPAASPLDAELSEQKTGMEELNVDEELFTSASDTESGSGSSAEGASSSCSGSSERSVSATEPVEALVNGSTASPAAAATEPAVAKEGESRESEDDPDVQIVADVPARVSAAPGHRMTMASGTGGAPRRSRRKNFGNRYEEAILKEKEDGQQAPTRTRAELLEGKSDDWDADEDSEADDLDFHPGALSVNGIDSQSGSSGSDSSSSDGSDSPSDGDDARTMAGPSTGNAHHHKKKDPLNAIVEQKQSLDALLDEIARSDKLEDVKICSICLWDEYDVEKDAVVQCDACGVPVHEACYGVMGQAEEEAHAASADARSSADTMPWFCDPCRYGEKDPRCIACPNRYGAFKQTVKGDWIHGACARYIREIYFDDEQGFCDAVLTELPYARWGDRPCVICEDVYAKNAGVTINCETGMCRKHLHATCAMMVGTAAELEPEMGYPLAVYCPDHCPKEDRASNRRCFLASLGLQRKHELSLKGLSEEERGRLEAAEKKQRESYMKRRKERQPEAGTESCARPLHSAYWLLMNGHERSAALGWDAKPVVNANPSVDNVRSARPDFRPEFVAYVFKREKQISECLERMDAACETRREVLRSRGRFDPTTGKAAGKRYATELQYERQTLMTLCRLFLPHMEAPGSSVRRASLKGKRRTEEPAETQTPRRNMEPRCKVCASSSFPQRMVQCEDCKERFHLKCLDPPLTAMPNSRRGVKWLCSECVPSSEDSSDESGEGGEGQTKEERAAGASGRKKRRGQGQNPALQQLKASSAEALQQQPAKRRKPAIGLQHPAKKQRSQVAVGDGAASTSGLRMASPRGAHRLAGSGKSGAPVGRKRRSGEEEKTGVCCKCQAVGNNQDAVECDKCHRWFHFRTCLDPPMVRRPRSRFYGWLCEDCSSPTPERLSDKEEKGGADVG